MCDRIAQRFEDFRRSYIVFDPDKEELATTSLYDIAESKIEITAETQRTQRNAEKEKGGNTKP